MSQIVKDVRRNKIKRPKAAGEGDQSERGAPRKTFSDIPSRSNNVSIRSRQHQRRSSDISNDHGFSPPKDNDGKVEFHVGSNRNNASNDRNSAAKNIIDAQPELQHSTNTSSPKKSTKLRIQRAMDLTTTSSILCMSVLGVKLDGFIKLMPPKWNFDSMLTKLYELGDLTEKNDALTNALAHNFEHSNEGFMAALCALKTTGIKDACELVITLFDRDFDGKVTKKDLYYHFNAAIPADTKDLEKEFAKSKERAKEIFRVFDIEGNGFFDKKDVMVGLKSDPRNVALLSINLVRDKKWQRTSICACRGPKQSSLVTWMKDRKRELRERKKAAKKEQQQQSQLQQQNKSKKNKLLSNRNKDSNNKNGSDGSSQLEERRKAREKQREEMRLRIQNQKINLKAQKKFSKENEKGFSIVLKEDKKNQQQQQREKNIQSTNKFKEIMIEDDDDEEEDEIIDEIYEEESDQNDDNDAEEDFLDESIGEDILASSNGSLSYSQQFGT